jgi:hypothetical protein
MNEQAFQAILFIGGIVVAIIASLLRDKFKNLESSKKLADSMAFGMRKLADDLREIKDDAKTIASLMKKLDSIREEQIKQKASLEAAWRFIEELRERSHV